MGFQLNLYRHRFSSHFSSTSRPLVGIVPGAAHFNYQRYPALDRCAYLYTTSPYSEHRGNKILFPPSFPWKQKPISVFIFPAPPGHWLASLLVQHASTIRDSRCLTGARTCTPRHHTWSTAETGSCFPHLFLGNRNPFPFPFFQYLQATGWHRCWCSMLQLSEIAGI
jgi:hypothetical protein